MKSAANLRASNSQAAESAYNLTNKGLSPDPSRKQLQRNDSYETLT
jgi:hypothetical protein